MGTVKLVQNNGCALMVELIQPYHINSITLVCVFRGLDFPFCIDQKQIGINGRPRGDKPIDIFERKQAAKIVCIIPKDRKGFSFKIFCKKCYRRAATNC